LVPRGWIIAGLLYSRPPRGGGAFVPVSITRSIEKERNPQIAQMQWAVAIAAVKTQRCFSYLCHLWMSFFAPFLRRDSGSDALAVPRSTIDRADKRQPCNARRASFLAAVYETDSLTFLEWTLHLTLRASRQSANRLSHLAGHRQTGQAFAGAGFFFNLLSL
jgi:hypothetical protein